MNTNETAADGRTALIIGASRGLGHAIAAELLARGWSVIGTVRETSTETPLGALEASSGGRLRREILDIDRPDQLTALRDRLASERLDILFINAGATNPDPTETIGQVSTSDFTSLMVTNALSPMRAIEQLAALVPSDGLIGAMSSGQGSLGNNERGGRELYRGSKAALNMFMRSFAAREGEQPRALLLLAPGWIRTELGGPDAPFTVAESAPRLVDVMLAKRRRPGLEYLDRDGAAVPW